jgi:cytolysin-activating lysine-acyltransferase
MTQPTEPTFPIGQRRDKLRPKDWKSGPQAWVVEVIAAFGGGDAMVADLKQAVFPATPLRTLAIGASGAREVRVV